ncbi:DNA polymerase delta small subunit [Scheffersomyces xylosifermentans]|uniref:DNA polymerase delta small subunit n=1 Tax=Scheffersomyces xylosifermentans TaxID=1304137 RepID=UPI00315C5288
MVEYTDYLNKGVSEPGEVSTRATVEYQSDYPKRSEFTIASNERKYDHQFFSMYQYRFKELKERIFDNALQKWGDGTRKIDGQTIRRQDKILDITSGQLCWVIGTVFCDLKNKLNILQDVDKGVDDVLPIPPDSYVGDDEEAITVMLEDESGRAILHNEGFLDKNILVTGCIVAVLGMEIQAGIFEIMDVVYPEAAPQKPLKSNLEGSNKKIAIVSGLSIDEGVEGDLRLEILKQYLIGGLGSSEDSNDTSSITRLIIAGDSIKPIQEVGDRENRDFITTNNYGSKNISQYNPESLIKFDEFLSEILISLPVSVMPGNNDLSEICLPQQPMHRSLFRKNAQYLNGEYLESLTNPYWFNIDNLRILGTSGQNVDDVLKYLPKTLSKLILTIMESHIKWQNFIPTAPDTLYCYPFNDKDPFTFVDETPHVYFAGNQMKYGSEAIPLKNGGTVRIISVPKFSETGEFVILDLESLETEVVKIEI